MSHFFLLKRNARFIHAVFACEICSHHIDTFVGVKKHASTKSHRKAKKVIKFYRKLVKKSLNFQTIGKNHRRIDTGTATTIRTTQNCVEWHFEENG